MNLQELQYIRHFFIGIHFVALIGALCQRGKKLSSSLTLSLLPLGRYKMRVWKKFCFKGSREREREQRERERERERELGKAMAFANGVICMHI
jgi:hypothetical protein